MTGNLGRNQAQALQPILRDKKNLVSGVSLEWVPTDNIPKRKYSHAITHDANALRDSGLRRTACCSRAAEIFNFRLLQ